MKKFAIIAAAASALSLAACDTAAEQKVDEQTEAKADALENQADAVREADPGVNSQVNEAKADALEEKADVVRAEGEVKAEKQEAADEAAGKTAPDAPVPATATTEKK